MGWRLLALLSFLTGDPRKYNPQRVNRVNAAVTSLKGRMRDRHIVMNVAHVLMRETASAGRVEAG